MKIETRELLIENSLVAADPTPISGSNLLHGSVNIGPEYEIAFDFKLDAIREGEWSNVLDVTLTPWQGAIAGYRCPSVFIPPSSQSLHICTAISDETSHCFNTDLLDLGQWYNLKITQSQVDLGFDHGTSGTKHVWEIFLNGERVYTVDNSAPQTFENVNVLMSNSWPPALGEYDNFSFNPDLTSTVAEHTINPNLDQLFIDQYKVWSCFRDTVTGFYCDQMSTTAVSNCSGFFSAASTGWGLIIDAIAAETGLISRDVALRRAKETMTNINSNWPRDSNGWFSHWTERTFVKVGEYSTIDSAIMISGSYFAAKYFQDAELTELAASIGATPNYDLIFDGDNGDRMFMISEGAGAMSAKTAPFNEYYLLSYLAKIHEAEGNTRAASFFEDCFGEDGKPVGRNGYPFTTEYNGHEMMSDGNWLVTTFTVQFPWFAVKGMHDNKFWSETVYPSWAAAERDYWSPSGGANVDWAAFDTAWGVSGTAGHAFGCGAGDSPASYMVQSMDGSAYNIFSAANMAPFMAVDDQVEADLNWLYDNDVAYVKSFKDGSTAKLLWRYSGLWTWWRASTVTSVDYSTMVMGYALKHLPEDFYPMHNSCILNEPTTTTPPTTTTSTTTTTTTTTLPPTTTTPTTTTPTTTTTTTTTEPTTSTREHNIKSSMQQPHLLSFLQFYSIMSTI